MRDDPEKIVRPIRKLFDQILLEGFGGTATDTLSACRKSFLSWNDELFLEREELEKSIHRSVGLKLAARYIQALAQAATTNGKVEEEDIEPARRISLALLDASNGHESPLFHPESKAHVLTEQLLKTRKSPSRLIVEGRAVGCVWFLVEASHGDISARRAADDVAMWFSMMGHKARKGGVLTGNTVRKWFDEVVLATGLEADRFEGSGLVKSESLADHVRQRAAMETFNKLAEQHLKEPDLSWLNKAIWKLAAEHSVSASQFAIALSR